MAENLSTRQRQILEFIVQFMAEHHYPPTIREIGVNAEISSTSVVNYNLNKLETMGLIARDKEVSRGLSLKWDELGRIGLQVDAAAMPAPAPSVKSENGRRNGRRERAERFNVPVLGQIAAGRPIAVEAVDAQNAEDYVEVARTFVGVRDSLFALRVRGNSMVDASVLNGDIVVLNQQDSAEDGDMVAAWNKEREETTLKYFYRHGDQVELRPANPAFTSIWLPADQVRINGKVVTVIRVFQ